jgi:hypothetical protein
MITTVGPRRPAARLRIRARPLERGVLPVIRLVVVAALVVDAVVHLSDAADYGAVRTSVLSQATLFRVEAGLAIVIAVALLLRPSRLSWLAAVGLLGSAFAAVLLYTYVDVGRLGPVPNMYEPTWVLPGKLASAWAEGVGAAAAVVGLVLAFRASRRRRTALLR